MTDSFDPKAPKNARRKSQRQPATIDLEATVLDNGRPEEQVAADTDRLVSEAMADTEASLDSGPATDSIEAKPEAGAGTDTLGPNTPGTDGMSTGSSDAPPPISEPPRRGSTGLVIGAGILGGLIGGGLVYGLQSLRAPTAQDEPRLTQLEQRIAALGQPANTQPLDNRIRALEEARAAVDQRLQAAQNAAQQAGARAQEALNRPAPEAPAQPQDEAALKSLADRLAALEGQFQTQAQGTQEAAASAQALQQSAQVLQQSVQGLDSRVAQNDQRLAALSQQVTQGPDPATLAAIRISLSERLNDALARGVPFAETLTALKKVDGNAARLAPLEPFAQQGAPTASQLARSFTPLGAAILRDDRAATGTWSDRFWRMLDRVVTIRPVDQPGSTDVSSLVARIDQALNRGNVPEAVAAWEALPEPARRISEEWGRQAKARAAADTAARAVADDALAALNTTTQQ